jgi:hypothetical protein
MNARFGFALAALLAASPSLSAQTVAARPPANPARVELEDLRTALEGAVGRSARIRMAAAARNAGRVYRLKGYGAVIVLAPRALPARRLAMRRGGPAAPAPVASPGPRVVITMPEGTFDVGVIDLRDLEQEMEVQMAAQAAFLREMESAQREWTHAHEEEIREHLQLVEQQAEAFRLEAERARRRAEREVRTRLAPPPAPPAPPAPVAPVAPVAPPAPPEPLDVPPPPWRFWFDVTEGSDLPDAADTADADALVASVRERLVAGLDAYRRPLASLRPEEFVAIAVDLVPDVLLRGRPTRTLLVRVRAGDLQERRSGRLSGAELRKRIEFEEN